MDRRNFVMGAGALGLVCVGFAATSGRNFYYAALSESVSEYLSVADAHQQAQAGDLVLIDIRRPDEWAATGSPASGHRLDMRREDFTEALLQLTDGARNARVALICARGVRSSRLTNRLVEGGFSNVIDVPEGMLGSVAGPGWIREGLPVDRS